MALRTERGKKMSPEERRAFKARQEALRKVAIRAKARQFYKMANAVAVIGALVALTSFFRHLYRDEGETRGGYLLARQVLETGRAFQSTGKTVVRSEEVEASPAQHLLSFIPIGLFAMLVLFLIDIVDPLGAPLHVLGMLYGIFGSAVVFWVSFWQKWPGVLGGPLVPILLGLFIMFVGCMAALPGAARRTAEKEDACDEAETTAGGAPAEDTAGEEEPVTETGDAGEPAQDTGSAGDDGSFGLSGGG